MTDTTTGFTLVRTLPATPEQIWSAWTDPDEAAQWFHPEGLSTPRDSVQMDVRVGGRYTYTMVNEADGAEYVTGGVYREVSPFERLVFTWDDPGSDPQGSPLITVTLTPTEGGTELALELRGAQGARGDDGIYDGWDSALDVLEGHLRTS